MVSFRVSDMTCGHCASTIARAVAAVDKAARIDVRLADKLVSIETAASEAELAEAIAEAGYSPERVAAAAVPAGRASGGCGCSPGAVDVRQGNGRDAGSCCG